MFSFPAEEFLKFVVADSRSEVKNVLSEKSVQIYDENVDFIFQNEEMFLYI